MAQMGEWKSQGGYIILTIYVNTYMRDMHI